MDDVAEEALDTEKCTDDTIADFEFENAVNLEDIHIEICSIVTKFCKLAKCIRPSVKAKETASVTITIDVCTRWNSALEMLMSMLKLKSPLVLFLVHLKTAEGKKEFNTPKLPSIMEDNWILVEGLCCILAPFKHVSNLLSGEQYPTLIEALPNGYAAERFLS